MSEHKLAMETRAAQILKFALAEYQDEPDLIADMIEGETNLHDAISNVMDGITEDEVMIAGLRSMTEQLVNRRLRFENRIDRRRSAIERAMAVGEITKLELPQATLSVRRVPPALHIVSESLIPDGFWSPQPPKLDRKNITEALKAGRDVPGAALDNGSTTLAIRRA